MEKLGQFIKENRENANLTQKQLSENLNVDIQTVVAWENCDKLPELDVVVSLAKELNITINELLTQEIKKEEVVTRKYALPLLITLGAIFVLGIVFIVSEYIKLL